MQVPIPITFEPLPETLSDNVLAAPGVRGIYALDSPGNPPHISWSINLRRRLQRLLVPSYTATPQNLTPLAAKITLVSYWTVSSRLETALILYELTRNSYPDSYLRRLHLRMPWFVGLTQQDPFARLAVTNRLDQTGSRFGPFRTREAAQLYEEQILGLHQLRRCTESLSPSPEHPGCIYGEMNQCLRPCQSMVSREEYGSEAARVQGFLQSAGQSTLQLLSAARDRAAADLNFEQAALAHKRMEKVQAANASRDKAIAEVRHFHGVAVTRAGNADSIRLWPLFAGYWQAPVTLYLAAHQLQEARSLDAMLRERLQDSLAAPSADGSRLEQMALFSRWYYSSWRDGEWFPFENLKQLNYRKMVRAISNLLKERSG